MSRVTASSPPGQQTDLVPALEIGGTHVAAALVDTSIWRLVPSSRHHAPLRSDSSAEQILADVLACANAVDAVPASRWGVAIPGPFDYERGIGRFEGVGKFDALYGVDVRQALLDGLRPPAATVAFLNDADAFLLGEWVAGAAAGHHRAVGLTLGTGVGSAFLVEGTVVDNDPTIPPEGRVDLLTIGGRRLEETVSRQAILARYARLAGEATTTLDVREVAERARRGEPAAHQVVTEAFTALGRTLAPWLARFAATVLVVGGSMAASWELIAGPLRAGIRQAAPAAAEQTVLVCAARSAEAALIGAARHATRHAAGLAAAKAPNASQDAEA